MVGLDFGRTVTGPYGLDFGRWETSRKFINDMTDSGQFIVPLSFLRLPLNDVTAVEYCSIDVMFLPDLLHFHDDKGTVVQSTKDVEYRSLSST